MLKITDGAGQVDYDFAVVNVLDQEHPDQLPPSIHAAYSPTFGIKPGDPVTFLVRTFRTTDGKETWDFGDGSPKVEVQSDGNVVPLAKDGYARTVHRFEKPGHYLVRVERNEPPRPDSDRTCERACWDRWREVILRPYSLAAHSSPNSRFRSSWLIVRPSATCCRARGIDFRNSGSRSRAYQARSSSSNGVTSATA